MGSVSGDLTLFGDLRDLLIQTWKRIWVEPDADNCVMGLSLAGVSFSTVPFINGSYAVAKSLAKYSQKMPAMCHIRVISSPETEEGEEALKGILNVPDRYIGRKFIKELEEFSERQGMRLYRGLKSMRIDLPYIRKNVKAFLVFMGPLIEDSDSLKPGELIGYLRSTLDYDRYVTEEDIPRGCSPSCSRSRMI